jgi:hypothetical protein
MDGFPLFMAIPMHEKLHSMLHPQRYSSIGLALVKLESSRQPDLSAGSQSQWLAGRSSVSQR